jgi:hypothetical protein
MTACLANQLLIFDGAGGVTHFVGIYSHYLRELQSAPAETPDWKGRQ